MFDADEVGAMLVGAKLTTATDGTLAWVKRESLSRWSMSCTRPGSQSQVSVRLSAWQLKDPKVVRRELDKALRTIFG